MLNAKITEKLNQQINKEFQSAYLYLDISNYYNARDISGFGAWFNLLFQQKLKHAKLFIEYLFEHGEKVNIDNTAKEKYSNHFNDFMNPMRLSLLKEQDNNLSINEIYDLAKEINDHETVLFIADFIYKKLVDKECFNNFPLEAEQKKFLDD